MLIDFGWDLIDFGWDFDRFWLRFAIKTVEGLSPADKQRVFTQCLGLRAAEPLPQAFFMQRHNVVGNIPKNYTLRLGQRSSRLPRIEEGIGAI